METTVSLYTNPYFTQNFVGLQNQNYESYIETDDHGVYRFEDGSGDARGSLLLAESNGAAVPCGGYDSPIFVPRTVSIPPVSSSDLPTSNSDNTEEFQVSDGSNKSTTEPTDYEGRSSSWSLGHAIMRPVTALRMGQEHFTREDETVFVLGLRTNVTKDDIVMFFSTVGHIKIHENTQKPKIFVYKNKLTGRSKGEATITYVSPYSAHAAINFLNGTKFLGHTITVLQAYLSNRQGNGVRYIYPQELGVEHQRRQRQRKWQPAADNWVCEFCRNSNFVWRLNCNRCQASKAELTRPIPPHWHAQGTDWTCEFCANINFRYRSKCNQCGAPKWEKAERVAAPDKWELVLSQPSSE